MRKLPSKKHKQQFRYKARRNSLRKRLFEYLKGRECLDCGEGDFAVLQFDHVRGKKRYNIATMVGSRFSWIDIMKEINKCDIVCANCHQKRTAKQQGWYACLDIK